MLDYSEKHTKNMIVLHDYCDYWLVHVVMVVMF